MSLHPVSTMRATSEDAKRPMAVGVYGGVSTVSTVFTSNYTCAHPHARTRTRTHESPREDSGDRWRRGDTKTPWVLSAGRRVGGSLSPGFRLFPIFSGSI